MLDTNAILEFGYKVIVPLMFFGIGAYLLSKAPKGKIGDAFTTGTIAIIGVIFMVGAAGFLAFATGIANLALPGN